MVFPPLYRRHPLFNFLDPQKVKSDVTVVKKYFETDDETAIISVLQREDDYWHGYLDNLMKNRRKSLFNSKTPIPNERKQIGDLASTGNPLAIEMRTIYTCDNLLPREWPIDEIEQERQQFQNLTQTPITPTDAYDAAVYRALLVVYYPSFFLISNYSN